jgi:hypothetical protein
MHMEFFIDTAKVDESKLLPPEGGSFGVGLQAR